MRKKLFALTGLAAASTMLLAGCVQNQPSSEEPSGNVLTVSSTADACDVSAATAESGNVTFTIANDGDQTTEFYLLGEDGLRIVSERENIAPGSSADLSVSLQPGDYFTACKPGMRGANIGEAAFQVTGEPIELTGEDQELFDQVVVDYINFVKNEIAELVPNVEEFAQAYIDGDDDTARELYADIRVNYERIEPVAEALGVLDPRIDYREIDYLAEADLLAEDDPTFTEWLGFHRIEKDLWVPEDDAVQPDGASAWEDWEPSTDEQRKTIGETLISDVNALYDAVHDENFIADQQIDVATVSNGASSLLEEIAVGKVTGEENWWSHYDLWDFQANLEGSRIAFDLVAPIAERKGAEGTELVTTINAEFDALQALLDQYGNLDDGFVLYDEVTTEQQNELVDQINALREPLSKLTGTVLGIEAPEEE
ncbi:peptidase M75 family protein [Leucobacter weissii]|uniref:Peptidase M75 family protein n=1 Tax=Leucobacter weissii TaxID=1983706 RepID=A0A939SCX9_9MICO|nr:iron uptake system protein EfeO [Leucobacter weissii]MBO1902890.1 peptidase M75 family protein [Leucobacter weissii]